MRNLGYIVHNIVPEKYRPTEDNKPGMFPHPIAIAFDDNGHFAFVDFEPVEKTSRLVKGRLHNPVNLQVMKESIRECRSIIIVDGICLACEFGIGILTIGVTKSIITDVSKIKGKMH